MKTSRRERNMERKSQRGARYTSDAHTLTQGGESGVVWKGLLAWAVVSVICFAIFGADAAGKYHICESSEAAKPAGGAPPAGDGVVEEQPEA